MTKKNLVTIIGALALMTAVSGCQDYDFGYDADTAEQEKFLQSDQFDFTTSGYATLTVDYNAPGYNCPVQLYTEYPYDEEGDLKAGVKAAYAFFLQDGKFEGTLNLPTACQRVWLETSGIGLPLLIEGDVVNGHISISNLTRAAINSTDVNDTYTEVQTTVVADFSAQEWQTGVAKGKTDAVTVGGVTFYQADGSQADGSQRTFADGTSWNGRIQTKGSGSIESSAKRYIKFSVSNACTITVYGESGGDETRTLRIAQKVNGTVKEIASTPLAKGERGIVSGRVTAGDVYVYALEGVNYYGITRTTSQILSVDDYQFLSGATYANITAETSTLAKNNFVALYPWSATGRPLVNVISKSTSDIGISADYHYHYYYNEQKEVVSNGITLKNTVQVDDNYSSEMVDNVYLSIYNMVAKNYWNFGKHVITDADGNSKDHNDRLYINDPAAGTIRLYLYQASSKKLSIDGTQTSMTAKEEVASNVFLYEIPVNDRSETDRKYHWIDRNNNAMIIRAEFETPEKTEDVDGVEVVTPSRRYACWFYNNADAANCLHNDTDTGSEGAAGMFTWNGRAEDIVNAGQTEIKTAKDTKSVYQGNLNFYYGVNMYHDKNSSDTSDETNFTFTLPKATTATLTVVFAQDYDGTKNNNGYYYFNLNGKQKLPASADRIKTNNVYQEGLAASMTEDTQFTITPGNGTRRILYVGVDKKDHYTQTELRQEVKKFARYDDAKALPKYKLADVLSRLQTALWSYDENQQAITNPENSSEIARSKANAKTWGGDAFNLNKAIKHGSAQDMNVVNKTKLYVTFLAEYNMRSANVLCYYFYKTGSKPSSPDNLKKYIIFPNCTSAHYTLSKTYKVNDKYGNLEDAVPLTTGDQVQLMYYDESTRQYSEEFPAGTTVGWCVLYNGFDAWKAESQDLASCKVRLDARNNDDFRNTGSGTIQPYSRFYYSNKEWNETVTYAPTTTTSSASTRALPTESTSTNVRCIAVTDELTKQISYCFEDSYKEETGADGVASTTKKDYTYDDLLFTVTATNNTDINDPNEDKLITKEDVPNVTYTEDGMYLFEDIWEGDRTDFDMNDVVIDYKRTYTINSSNRIVSISEKYTLINDGGTYDDGFAVQLPYTVDDVLAVTVSVNGSAPEKLAATTDITPNSDRSSRLERDLTKNKLNLVVFDHINLFAEGEMKNVTYEYVITFKADKEPSVTLDRNTTNIDSETNVAQSITYAYGRNAYNPFIIVYKYSTANGFSVEENRRCEIHLPGKETTQWGVVPGSINLGKDNNNRWYVAKITSALTSLGIDDNLNAMPFGLDLPIDESALPGTGENQLIHEAYPKFVEWVTSSGSNSQDWYSLSNRSGAAKTWQYIGAE